MRRIFTGATVAGGSLLLVSARRARRQDRCCSSPSARWERSSSPPGSAPRGARTSAPQPGPMALADRLRHQLLRHARHRLLRADDARSGSSRASSRTRRSPGRSTSGTRCRRSSRRSSSSRSCEVEMTTLIAHDRGVRRSARGSAPGSSPRWPRRRVQLGMGVALLAAACFFAMTNLGHRPGRRRDARASRSPLALGRHRRQLRARRAHDARHRSVRALHDPGRAPRHEPARRVSDHDGLVRVPDAGRRPAFHRQGQLLAARRRGPDDRRHSGRPHRGLSRQDRFP